MASFNKCILMGNLVRDIELRFTPKGTAIGQVTLAVNRSWMDDSGQKREECAFIGCVIFGKQAETAAQYVKKGDPWLVEGRLSQDSWEDKETGKKREKTKVTVEKFTFVHSRRTTNDSNGNSGPEGQSQSARPAEQPHLPAVNEDAVPF